MRELLEAIEFETRILDDQRLEVTAPSFRVDISRPQDLMEEIARRHGYDNIPVTFPEIPGTPLKTAKLVLKRRTIREIMTGMGFSEAVTYSFIHSASPDRLRLAEDDERRRQVAVVNPLSEDQAVMRTSLVPGLLQTVQRNLAHQSKTLKLFETGRTFIDAGTGSLPVENEMLAGLWTGDRSGKRLVRKIRNMRFLRPKRCCREPSGCIADTRSAVFKTDERTGTLFPVRSGGPDNH